MVPVNGNRPDESANYRPHEVIRKARRVSARGFRADSQILSEQDGSESA
jgi:hypothetical protein